MNVSIRAHHLLCTTEFSGHGYSDGFAAYMSKVVYLLHNGDDHIVTLVCSPDIICSACPNLVCVGSDLSRGICRSDDNHVVLKDQDVLSFLHLEEDRPYHLSFLLSVLEKHLDQDTFDRLCGKCSWHVQGLCSRESMISHAKALSQQL